MKSSLTPKELAQAIGVSESSLKRWADDGLLLAARTPGGHRRIAMAEAVRFIRASRATIVRPDLLGFGDLPGPLTGVQTSEDPGQILFEALYQDDHLKARTLLLSAFMSGMPVSTLCDGPMRFAFTRIGELWHHEANGIMIEHRATDTCCQAMHLIRSLLPTPCPLTTASALGGAPSGDPYLMPSLMVATVLAEVGYRDLNLGPDTPLATLQRAIAHYRPQLVWLAVSSPMAPERLIDKILQLTTQLAESDGTLIIGGRSLGDVAIPAIANLQVARSMTELACAAQNLRRPAKTVPG
ncbi:MAG: MerR family DNA-binding transcriptional regulator [Candidatus Sericytochromatia bacterium]|nr:MerR family DNA-binding transcriptional regulator [Candidatus Sericytochromatia bacterium]